MATTKAGTGYTLTSDGKTATLKIDLTGRHGASKSGKSITVATTSGNIEVDGVKIGFNAYIPA